MIEPNDIVQIQGEAVVMRVEDDVIFVEDPLNPGSEIGVPARSCSRKVNPSADPVGTVRQFENPEGSGKYVRCIQVTAQWGNRVYVRLDLPGPVPPADLNRSRVVTTIAPRYEGVPE